VSGMNMSAFNRAWYVLKGWQDEETSLTDELDPSRGAREGKQFEQDVPPRPDYSNMSPQELQIELDEIIDQITNLERDKQDIQFELDSLHSGSASTSAGQTMDTETNDIISRLKASGKLPPDFQLG